MTSAFSAYADVHGRAVVLDPQPLVAADELAVVVADQRAGQQVGLAEDLEAVADAEHRQAAAGRLDDLGHHRREPGDRAAAEVVAVREAAGQDHRVDALEVVVAVPERDGLVAADADGALGVDVVEGTGEGDDPDLHARPSPAATSATEWSSTWTSKSSITGLESRVSAIWATSASSVVGDLAVDLELEPLALADVGHALEAQAGQGAEHGLALGVEDLWLGHDVDDDTGHGDSLAAVGIPRRVYPWPVSSLGRWSVAQRVMVVFFEKNRPSPVTTSHIGASSAGTPGTPRPTTISVVWSTGSTETTPIHLATVRSRNAM